MHIPPYTLVKLYVHQFKYKMLYISKYQYNRRPIYGIWANLLLVRYKYVTPTGKWLHADYIQTRKHFYKLPFDITARGKRYVRLVQWVGTYIHKTNNLTPQIQ